MLKGITITGADDAVDANELLALSERYPFVEWGVLFSATRAGSPRYPTREWVEWATTNARMIPSHRLSAHLCGEIAASPLKGESTYLATLQGAGFKRVQINGWKPSAMLVQAMRLAPKLEVILQARAVPVVEEACVHALAIRGMGAEASVLFDASAGHGIPIVDYPIGFGAVMVGYAGGITPESIGLTLKHLLQQDRPSFWLDMETGVRTNDVFDLAKVRAVLEAVAAVLAEQEANPWPNPR